MQYNFSNLYFLSKKVGAWLTQCLLFAKLILFSLLKANFNSSQEYGIDTIELTFFSLGFTT